MSDFIWFKASKKIILLEGRTFDSNNGTDPSSSTILLK